ncbi:hypothetical protein OWM07_01870 [Deferribacter thermophilus]|uniref:hypothetical protein n=1 Tax=Deferribacter thermophilus TaxID=53573 RepID=UPI003C1D2FF8
MLEFLFLLFFVGLFVFGLGFGIYALIKNVDKDTIKTVKEVNKKYTAKNVTNNDAVIFMENIEERYRKMHLNIPPYDCLYDDKGMLP